MEVVNILKFLNSVGSLHSLDYAECNRSLVNILDLISEDEQFTQTIDLGIIYLSRDPSDNYVIVDGLSRILSLSLLLHAICECYKKTTDRNTRAINTIRKKYLFSTKTRLKLQLPEQDSKIYAKIINGERLSGAEKTKSMFVLLHDFWTRIKEDNLQASKIFKMLQKINVVIVEADDVSPRDLFYLLNREKREINQMVLIDDFIKEQNLIDDWNSVKSLYFVEKGDDVRFLKDFLITKFNYKTFKEENLYESFKNYYKTMKRYVSKDVLMQKLRKSALLYYNMLNVEFKSEELCRMFVNIKRHNGEDTYAYILNVYEDYETGNISESIFIEILKTIDEYLKNRQTTGKNIDFNELILYLNAFISYK